METTILIKLNEPSSELYCELSSEPSSEPSSKLSSEPSSKPSSALLNEPSDINNDSANTSNDLSGRMKKYEKTLDTNIPPYMPYIVRLDGVSFSKFTTGLRRPFDNNFTSAMIKTMNDMVDKFSAKTGYTHSDEITLVFDKICTVDDYNNGVYLSVHPFNGRLQKLCSIYASYCSVRFNHHFEKLINLNKHFYKQNMIDKVDGHTATFDARIIIFSDIGDVNLEDIDIDFQSREIVNHMIWRSIRDCHRNAVFTYCSKYFSHTELDHKNSDELITMLKEKHNIDWKKDVPIFLKHGVYGKRESYIKETTIDDQIIQSTRQRITNKSFIVTYSDEMYKLLMNKHWLPEMKTDFYDICMSTDGSIKVMQSEE